MIASGGLAYVWAWETREGAFETSFQQFLNGFEKETKVWTDEVINVIFGLHLLLLRKITVPRSF